MKFSFGLHSRVDIPIDDKGLAPHPDIFFGHDLDNKQKELHQ